MDSELVFEWTHTILKALGLLIIVVLVVVWVWCQWAYRRLLPLAKTLPTVEPVVPFFGHLLNALKDDLGSMSSKFILNMVKKAAAQGEEAFCIWMGPFPYLVVQKPEDLQIVLSKASSLHKGFFHSLVEFAIGIGLLIGPVSRWRIIRRHLQPVFRISNLEHVVPSANDRGREIVQLLKEQCSRGPIDVLTFLRISTFKNACNLMFGKEVHKILPEDPKLQQRFVAAIMRALELWSARFLRPWLFSDRMFKFIYRKDLKEIEYVCNLFNQKVFQVLDEILSKKQKEEDTDNFDHMGQCTLFDAYISLSGAGIGFTKQNFYNEIITIISAGTNSAALSLSSHMLALAWHPEVQEKLHREIVFVMGHDLKREVTTEDIKNMPYLDQVVKESSRRYTIFAYNQRKTTEDLQLSFGVIPAGSSINVGMLGVHMNPKIYPDPYKFDPERFSAENISKRHKFSLLTFSGGPRNCIAMAYATLTIKIAIVHVLRKYTLHTNADMNLESFKFVIEAQREGGYPIWVEERSY